MSHLLFIFGLRLGGGGFLLREAHPQAWDELPGQGAPGEGCGQDGEAVGQQQALQCVLAEGTEGARPALPSCRVLPQSQCVPSAFWTQPKTGGSRWDPSPWRLLAKLSLQFLPASPAIRNR